MRLSVVAEVTGRLVVWFSPALLAPALVAAWHAERRDTVGFLVAFACTGATGLALRAPARRDGPGLGRLFRLEGLAIVSSTWLLVALLAAIPFVWAGMSPIDALFEAMSGLTTTGATVIRDFDAFGRGIYFWRALMHWIGGLGVIALFVAVLPRLAIGGRELFFAEAAGPTDEKITPQLRGTAIALWKVYIALTGAAAVALALAGMPLFDAVCHAMSTMAAGGLSPHSASISGYGSPLIEWIVLAFMFAAGANFALQYRAVRGSRVALVQDEEFRAYAGVVVAGGAALTLALAGEGMRAPEAVRHGFFQAVSVLTTTGFVSTDFQLWNDQAKIILLVLMFVGGCAGSAAGGPKVVRHLLMARVTFRELKRMVHPRGVLVVKLGGRMVPEHILRDVQVFMLFYLLTFAAGAVIVVALGADLMTGVTASIACLGNIGPGFNDIGPMSNFATLHPVSRVVLTLEMWIGRLEVLTVLALLRPEVWRSSRWR